MTLGEGFAVRPAAPSDAPELARLEAEARSSIVDSRGGAAWLEENEPVDWVDAFGADGWIGIAAIDGVPLGFLQMRPLDGRGVAQVAQVWVHPGARELGFGDVLLEEATAWARSAGAVALEGEALPGDRDTKNLYERAGITARKITVRAAL